MTLASLRGLEPVCSTLTSLCAKLLEVSPEGSELSPLINLWLADLGGQRNVYISRIEIKANVMDCVKWMKWELFATNIFDLAFKHLPEECSTYMAQMLCLIFQKLLRANTLSGFSPAKQAGAELDG